MKIRTKIKMIAIMFASIGLNIFASIPPKSIDDEITFFNSLKTFGSSSDEERAKKGFTVDSFTPAFLRHFGNTKFGPGALDKFKGYIEALEDGIASKAANIASLQQWIGVAKGISSDEAIYFDSVLRDIQDPRKLTSETISKEASERFSDRSKLLSFKKRFGAKASMQWQKFIDYIKALELNEINFLANLDTLNTMIATAIGVLEKLKSPSAVSVTSSKVPAGAAAAPAPRIGASAAAMPPRPLSAKASAPSTAASRPAAAFTGSAPAGSAPRSAYQGPTRGTQVVYVIPYQKESSKAYLSLFKDDFGMYNLRGLQGSSKESPDAIKERYMAQYGDQRNPDGQRYTLTTADHKFIYIEPVFFRLEPDAILNLNTMRISTPESIQIPESQIGSDVQIALNLWKDEIEKSKSRSRPEMISAAAAAAMPPRPLSARAAAPSAIASRPAAAFTGLAPAGTTPSSAYQGSTRGIQTVYVIPYQKIISSSAQMLLNKDASGMYHLISFQGSSEKSPETIKEEHMKKEGFIRMNPDPKYTILTPDHKMIYIEPIIIRLYPEGIVNLNLDTMKISTDSTLIPESQIGSDVRTALKLWKNEIEKSRNGSRPD